MIKKPFSNHKATRARIFEKSLYFAPHSLLTFLFSACGNKKVNNLETADQDISSLENETLISTLTLNTDYYSAGEGNETISSSYEIFKTVSLIEDGNTSDNDNLDITTTEDVAITPTISGIENINFILGEGYTAGDDTFDLDLNSFSEFYKVQIKNSSVLSKIKQVSLENVKGEIVLGEGITTISINAKSSEDISLATEENATITLTNDAKDLKIVGSGSNSIDLATSNQGDLEIFDSSSVLLSAPNATGNINIVSNANVTVSDVENLKGNIAISAVGSIDLDDISSVSGKIYIDNLRALEGTDVLIKGSTSAKSIDIKSSGAVTTELNGGFSSAEIIKITAAEDSTIYSTGTSSKVVELTGSNTASNEIDFNIDIDNISTLALKGSAPIKVVSSGEDLDQTIVTNTNTFSSSLLITAADTDLSSIADTVQIHLQNFDGSNVIVGQNQNFYLDTEISQTSNTAVPNYTFITPATETSDNKINFNIFDSNPSNLDYTAIVAGLALNEIQTLNLSLTDGSAINITGNIIGEALESINLLGAGDVTFTNSTIVGGLGNFFSLNGENFSGILTASIDDTQNSITSLTSGSGDDLIEVDGYRTTSAGVSINTGAGNDIISLTSNSDGDSVILSINGGDGIDTVNFASSLNFKSSNLNLTSIEYIEFTGGNNTVFIPSSTISNMDTTISENGSGNLNLSIFPNAQVVDLSSLKFDSSVSSGQDKIVVDGSNYSQPLTITGSKIDDEITGTHTSDDIISSGDGNDTISGSDGNDILTPGDGIDHITPGLGNDSINLSEIIAAVDTLYYSLDSGSNNVDTVTNFDIHVLNDLISLDVSETQSAITAGNAGATTATAAGGISIIDHDLDTDLDLSNNSTPSIVKLMITDQSDFATALGRGIITVADTAAIPFLWYDTDTDEAVFGYVDEASSAPDDNTIIEADTFIEIVRLSMTESSYSHYLGSENFAFI